MQQPVMILLALASFVLDSQSKQKAQRRGHAQFKTPREHNFFTFSAMVEVALLFIGIFITMTPALCLLKAHGAETGISQPWQFFWMSGGLSSFLDNAPTYSTYFALGQGVTKGLLASASNLSVVSIANGPIGEEILIAISAGSVFMGANTYIGNAPNFMIKTLCEEARIKMPSFFGYMLYSGLILIPSFLLIMFIYL
jgi:Na+/H+ antiporter NhaD/arsenite permease-like protein